MGKFFKPSGLFGWFGVTSAIAIPLAAAYQLWFTPFVILNQAQALEIATILMLCLGG